MKPIGLLLLVAAAVSATGYGQPEIRVNSYDAPALRSSYEAPAARLVDVPSVRVELSSSDYQAPAPALRSSYEAPEVKSSYEAPALRSNHESYDEPARIIDVPVIRVEMSSSDYQAPAPALPSAPLRSSYESPAPVVVRANNYEALRSSYESPAAPAPVEAVRVEIKSDLGSYQSPARQSAYEQPAIRVQSYEAPAALRSSY